jgi:two-component system response regulator MtrA
MAAPACLQRTYGDVVIDRVSLIVTCAGRQVSLTPTELRLLLVLSGSPRLVFFLGATA